MFDESVRRVLGVSPETLVPDRPGFTSGLDSLSLM